MDQNCRKNQKTWWEKKKIKKKLPESHESLKTSLLSQKKSDTELEFWKLVEKAAVKHKTPVCHLQKQYTKFVYLRYFKTCNMESQFFPDFLVNKRRRTSLDKKMNSQWEFCDDGGSFGL